MISTYVSESKLYLVGGTLIDTFFDYTSIVSLSLIKNN